MKWLVIAGGTLVVLAVAMPVLMYVQGRLSNPGVEDEVRNDPSGERAQKVMLLTLPSGRTIPVNFLREDGRVYAGADGWWWKELRDGPHEVTVFVQGEELFGRARAVTDQPEYRKDVFTRLRPTALPGFGTLVEVLLDPNDPGGPVR
ncbi:MAG: hypothetical protein NXI30_08750 [bacterium]|nr:hypothetical protein [bacterium]